MAEETKTLHELIASNLAISETTATLLIQRNIIPDADFQAKSETARASYLAAMRKSSFVGDWDLSQERQFIENLLCQRFDFLLLFYSLVVAGAFQTNSQLNFAVAFTVGAAICSLLAVSIFRTHNKLDLVLEKIESIDKDHPSAFTEREGKKRAATKPFTWLIRGSGRHLVGYWIPGLCAGSLIAAAIFSWCGGLTIADSPPIVYDHCSV